MFLMFVIVLNVFHLWRPTLSSGPAGFFIDQAHALPQDGDQAVYLFKYLYELLVYILVQEDNCNPVM